MLTLCEDALRANGEVSPNESGIYFRLVWGQGLPEEELRRYAKEFATLAGRSPDEALFPEALLQQVDQGWLTELPAPQEAAVYVVNRGWVKHLLARVGDRSGKTLELLGEYLLSCMPGCRTTRRQRSGSTDYDIVCSMEGFDVDFRSELGRYFVCECKDWDEPADFTTMAKFCRVLDSTKARFGILFSREGISGAGKSTNAEREQLKVFQDRGIVIVVIDFADLKAAASGANLIRLLRQRYEGHGHPTRPVVSPRWFGVPHPAQRFDSRKQCCGASARAPAVHRRSRSSGRLASILSSNVEPNSR
jgi:hypothetical protein